MRSSNERLPPGRRAAVRGLHGKLLILTLLLVLPLFGSLQLWLAHQMPWALLAYAVATPASFLLYRRDKAQARSDGWRTPESTLHLSELLGGWPGALLAQQMYRHKTRKLSFQLVFWGIVLLHQLVWAEWLSGGRLLAPALAGLIAH